MCEVGLGLITTKLPGMVKKEHPGDIILPGRLFIKPKKPVNPRDSYLPKKLQQEFSQVAEAKVKGHHGLLELIPANISHFSPDYQHL